MPISATAERELRDILRTFGAAHAGVVAPSGPGKALEAWVLMKLAWSVQRRLPSWNVSLRRGDEQPLPSGTPFVLPGGGSRIRPSHRNAPGYVHLASARESDFDLEVHGSLKWRGRSGAKHECDVSVIPAAIAHGLRTNGGGFPRGLPIAAVECKDKGRVGTLDETRQTLARMFDLALVTQPALGLPPNRIYEELTFTTWGRRSSTYLGFFAKGAFGIVRAGTFQAGARQLAQHYRILHHPSIYTDSGSMITLQVNFGVALSSIGGF
jgi:hypothetical protein